MIENKKITDYKNQLVSYISTTFFSDEKVFKDFLDSKCVLTALTEISSIAHRYSQTDDSKLKRLLLKQCVILLFQLELLIQYSEAKIDAEINLEEPTIYSPYKVSDLEINLADTIGKMCCNLSFGIWNDFEEKKYSLMALTPRVKQIQDADFWNFILKLQTYIVALLLKQSNSLINDILDNAFRIRIKNEKALNIIRNLKKNKPTPKVEIVEQPAIPERYIADAYVEQSLNADEIDDALTEIIPAPHQERYTEIQEIVLKESHINDNGELEESNIKTTIIKQGD